MNTIKQQILIKKVKNGDDEAFGEIYDEYIKKVYHFIFFRVATPETAQDLAHDVFVSLLMYIKTTSRKIESLAGLIFQIARSKIAAHYISQTTYNRETQDKLKIHEIDINEVDFKISNFENSNLDEQLDQKMTLDLVYECLKEIKNKEYQEILIFRLVEDLSHKQIAKLMNKNTGAVRVQLHRALTELKKIVFNKLKK